MTADVSKTMIRSLARSLARSSARSVVRSLTHPFVCSFSRLHTSSALPVNLAAWLAFRLFSQRTIAFVGNWRRTYILISEGKLSKVLISMRSLFDLRSRTRRAWGKGAGSEIADAALPTYLHRRRKHCHHRKKLSFIISSPLPRPLAGSMFTYSRTSLACSEENGSKSIPSLLLRRNRSSRN